MTSLTFTNTVPSALAAKSMPFLAPFYTKAPLGEGWKTRLRTPSPLCDPGMPRPFPGLRFRLVWLILPMVSEWEPKPTTSFSEAGWGRRE